MDTLYIYIIYIDVYTTEQHMNHFVHFSGDWKEPRDFCYESVDVLFWFCITGSTSQKVHSNFIYRKSLKCIIQTCKDTDIENLVHVSFCQIGVTGCKWLIMHVSL